MDIQAFLKNRAKVSEETLRQYEGMYVAFSGDGSSIVANGKSWEDLEAHIVSAGLDPEQVWFDYLYVDDGYIELGGVALIDDGFPDHSLPN